jgi:hypothetical protein
MRLSVEIHFLCTIGYMTTFVVIRPTRVESKANDNERRRRLMDQVLVQG